MGSISNNDSNRVEEFSPPTTEQLNMRCTGVKRLLKEAAELRHANEMFCARPMEDNLFEWHFSVRGPPDSSYAGGIYHGRIVLPPDYPMKPPNLILMTPNGRFETNKKICLSISGYHPETWLPSWSIRTALLALIGFMPTHSAGALGSLECSGEERRRLAIKSLDWRCEMCGVLMRDALPSAGSTGQCQTECLLKEIRGASAGGNKTATAIESLPPPLISNSSTTSSSNSSIGFTFPFPPPPLTSTALKKDTDNNDHSASAAQSHLHSSPTMTPPLLLNSSNSSAGAVAAQHTETAVHQRHAPPSLSPPLSTTASATTALLSTSETHRRSQQQQQRQNAPPLVPRNTSLFQPLLFIALLVFLLLVLLFRRLLFPIGSSSSAAGGQGDGHFSL